MDAIFCAGVGAGDACKVGEGWVVYSRLKGKGTGSGDLLLGLTGTVTNDEKTPHHACSTLRMFVPAHNIGTV